MEILHNFGIKIQNVDIMYINPISMAIQIHFNAYPMLCHGKYAVNSCFLTNFKSKFKNYNMTNYNMSFTGSYNL